MNKKGTILVADDDKAVLDTTSTLLEFFGYNVIQAKDGLDAVSKYRENKPGLVFLDVKMPKMSGYQAFFELEEEFPEAKVIFITAHADFSKWKKAKSMHALELIEKPYSAEKLRELAEKFYPKK
ncbi:MAG: response regulator [Nitrosopumilus sp.]|nr:response regulator [Nitrosopumilus sp.]MDH3340752.1 response regulator [Nitrosopumilus sp.]